MSYLIKECLHQQATFMIILHKHLQQATHKFGKTNKLSVKELLNKTVR